MVKRSGLRVSPSCRTLTGSEVLKDKLAQLYQLSQSREHENMIAVCKNKSGKLYTGSYSVFHEKSRVGGIIQPDYSEMIMAKDDPCKESGGKIVASIHTHPKGDSMFTNADLMTLDDKERSGCILYRRGDDLRLRCIDLERALKESPPIICGIPELCDPTIMSIAFTQPCDVSVGKGRVSSWRAPWKTY